MTRLIRATGISGLVEVIAEAGGDPDARLRAHGIDPAATEDFERFIVVDDAAAVVGDAARELGCADLGMRLGMHQSVRILGPVGILLRNAATVGDGLEGVCRYIGTIAPLDTIELIRTPQAAIFSYDTNLRNDWNRQQLVEKSLTVAMGALRSLLGDDFVPMRVTLRHGRMATPERYREVFGRPVDFECDRNAIHIPLRALSLPVPDRDAVALALAESYLSRTTPDLAIRVQAAEISRRLMVTGHASLVGVAGAMSLHPRALERRLAEEGDHVRESVG